MTAPGHTINVVPAGTSTSPTRVFFVASRRLTILTRHAVVSGILYGVAAYFVMNLVVLPLSAAGKPAFSWPVFVNGVLIHAFGVGLPAALFASAASAPTAHIRWGSVS